MERSQKSWKDLKHQPSKRTDVHNLIRAILERDLKPPSNPHKPMLNLGLGKLNIFWLKTNSDVFILGEPSKANGFELPPIINEVMIETIRAE